MSANTAKQISVMYDKVCEELNKSTILSSMVKVDSVDMATQQNANDVYHIPVEQQSPVLVGRDLTGQETGIIEQSVPLRIDEPRGDFITLNTSDMRDQGFWDRRIKASVKKLSTDLESQIMNEANRAATMYYETSSAGFDFMSEADSLFFERQIFDADGRTFLIDPRANASVAGNLASRTLFPNNRSEGAYSSAGVGQDVAGFDLYRNSYAKKVVGNTASTTTTAKVVLKPEGFGTTAEGTPYNVDSRVGVIPVTSSASFAVGDYVTMGVNACTLNDKEDTGQLMTFKVVGKDAGVLRVYPKPIAYDQRPAAQGGTGELTSEEAACANIATSIASGATVETVNTTAGTGRVSTFMANDAITVVNGREPIELLGELDGMKVERTTLDNGLDLYLAFDANLPTLNCRVRLFTRYGVVATKPSAIGTARYTG